MITNRIGAALLTCALTLTALLGPLAWSAAGAPGSGRLICDQNQHTLVANSKHRPYYLRSPYWHGGTGKQCIRSTGGARWLVAREAHNDGSNRVIGYPSIMTGCIWMICTPHTNLPMQVRAIKSFHSTWHVRHTLHGKPWVANAAYDIWFGKGKSGPGGRATRNGAELMIWLNWHAVGSQTLSSPKVKVAGHWWHLVTGRAHDAQLGISWNYISFRLVHRQWHVDALDINKLIHHLERHRHLIHPDWYLQTISAGFEIVSGGVGLGTNRFNVTVAHR
jgi:hypothetical protein